MRAQIRLSPCADSLKSIVPSDPSMPLSAYSCSTHLIVLIWPADQIGAFETTSVEPDAGSGRWFAQGRPYIWIMSLVRWHTR